MLISFFFTGSCVRFVPILSIKVAKGVRSHEKIGKAATISKQVGTLQSL